MSLQTLLEQCNGPENILPRTYTVLSESGIKIFIITKKAGFFHLIKYQQTVKFNVSGISYAATMNKRLIFKWTEV